MEPNKHGDVQRIRRSYTVRCEEFIDHTYKAFQEGPSYASLKAGSDRRPAVRCTYLYNIELQSFCITLTVVFVEPRYLDLNFQLRPCCAYVPYISSPQHISSTETLHSFFEISLLFRLRHVFSLCFICRIPFLFLFVVASIMVFIRVTAGIKVALRILS